MAYFDNAATTRISDAALDAYNHASTTWWGNPSSLHKEGLKARKRLEEDRSEIARLLHVAPATLTFTSCATESDGIILGNYLWAQQPGDIIIPAIEHSAVTGYTRLLKRLGWNIVTVDAPGGFLDPGEIAGALTERTRLVCCMLVNNVVGTIQPVKEIVQLVRRREQAIGRKIHIHTDATQALGKIPMDLHDLGVDSAAFSAHKIHGPKGVGLLYNKDTSIIALSRGGEQEKALRPGTENLPGIEAMTVAIADAVENLDSHIASYRALNAIARRRLASCPHIHIVTPEKLSSPAILTISNDKLPSEVLTRMLYDKDYCVSSGSACSNNAKGHQGSILMAMRQGPSIAKGAIRISFGTDNTMEEVEGLCDTLLSILGGV
ncbi:MAG: cysteine desulfurase family protein [Sphaerochaetaceae bacterium]|nr:cysteine desulfurase family protein [Spirochaetales bacterium]MDY5500139.1 cysteine desulfurase family protein [Sphaerochaetaceae bacterium]